MKSKQEYNKSYYSANQEKCKELSKKSYLKNKKTINEQKKELRQQFKQNQDYFIKKFKLDSTTKQCCQCKKEKVLLDFRIQLNTLNSFSSRRICKKCNSENIKKKTNEVSVEKKTCARCNQEKQSTAFSKLKSSKDGLYSYCKKCDKELSKQAYSDPKYRKKVVDYSKEYYNNNKEKWAVKRLKRTSLEEAAIPQWDTENEESLKFIKNLYKLKNSLVDLSGKQWHVDHIIPLKGLFGKKHVVCGLHTPDNLRIIEATENLSKNCYRWPDMFDYQDNGF